MRWMESGGRRVEVVGSMRSIASRDCSGSWEFFFLKFELFVYWHSDFERVVKFGLSARMARSFHASML